VHAAILAFPDNDIKELGDRWEGIDDDEESVSPQQVSAMIERAIEVARGGMSWAGDNTMITRDHVVMLFDPPGAKKTKNEIALKLKEVSNTIQAETAKDEEADMDRFTQIEEALKSHGLSLNLHDSYFQNLWLGTGIITVWTGFESIFEAVFLPKTVPNVGVNNVLRIAVAAGLFYLLDGNINSLGDGYLEDEEEGALETEEVAEIVTAQLYACHSHGSLQRIETHRKVKISQEELLSVFDGLLLDQDNGEGVRSAELLTALAKL